MGTSSVEVFSWERLAIHQGFSAPGGWQTEALITNIPIKAINLSFHVDGHLVDHAVLEARDSFRHF